MSNVFSADPLAPNPEDITVDTLVGEGRKYADPNQLAKAYAHADQRIAELEREKAELKVTADLLEAQRSEPPVNRGQDNQNRQENKPDPDPSPKGEKQEVDLSKLVKEEMEARDAQNTFTSNVDKAANRLTNHYGTPEKANEAVRKRAQELGVSTDWLLDAAGKSPAAFFASMGLNEGQSNNTPAPNNDVNFNRGQSVRGYKHFEEIRKTNPKAFYSPATQKEMFEARKTLGNDFYN